ncbi:MAG: hypothetical protein LBJ41_02605 [Treponema sp.]|nr:hypothetical protein [Treponema sp.]
MTRLDKSTAALMDSYRDYGLVNHAGGANLPSCKSIETILRKLDQIIFPGFRE